MNDLDEIYKRLARDWPHEELAAHYASARDHGARAIKNPRSAVARTLPMVASALPPAATLDVAVYALHMLPRDHTRRSSAPAPRQRQAERSGRAAPLPPRARTRRHRRQLHHRRVGAVCDRAAELLKSARPNEEPTNHGARGPRCDQLALPRPHRARTRTAPRPPPPSVKPKPACSPCGSSPRPPG